VANPSTFADHPTLRSLAGRRHRVSLRVSPLAKGIYRISGFEQGTVAQHGMHDDGEPSGERDAGLSQPAASRTGSISALRAWLALRRSLVFRPRLTDSCAIPSFDCLRLRRPLALRRSLMHRCRDEADQFVSTYECCLSRRGAWCRGLLQRACPHGCDQDEVRLTTASEA